MKALTTRNVDTTVRVFAIRQAICQKILKKLDKTPLEVVLTILATYFATVILTFNHGLNGVKVNRHVKYL